MRLFSTSLVLYRNQESEILEFRKQFESTNIKLYVVDNSEEDSRGKYFEGDNFEYIPLQKNIGYGTAHNIAIRKSLNEGYKYHVILNPDIVFDDSVLQGIAEFMDVHDDIGLCMPKILYPDGELQYLCKLLPNPINLFSRRFFPRKLTEYFNKNYELKYADYTKSFNVPSLSGCFMFCRNSVLHRIGGFDERFFMYCEDIDLSRRINEISKTVYFPNFKVIHKHAKESYKSKKMMMLHIRSAIKYFNKWGWLFDEKRFITNQNILRQIPCSRKKEVLIIQQYYYPDISAVSQLLGDLLTKLSQEGEYDITVLCGTNYRLAGLANNNSDYSQHGNVKIKRITTTLPGRKVFIHRLVEYTLFYIGVYSFVKKHRHKYDLFISMTTPPLIGYFVARALKKSEKPLIHYVEDLYPELLFDMSYLKRFWIVQRLYFINRYIIDRASKIITLGSYMTSKLKLNYDIASKKVLEIPNWVKDVEYRNPSPKKRFRILYSGNLGLAHDFSMLSCLLEEIEESSLDIEFVFVGAGRQYEYVRKIFSHYKVKHSFSGYCDKAEHSKILASADMLLISQKNETVGDIFPSKFYSYMAAGRPILLFGTEKSEIGEYLIEKNIGKVLEVEEDIESLISYIDYLLNDCTFFKKECRRIADLYQNEMGFDRSYKKFRDLLKEEVS